MDWPERVTMGSDGVYRWTCETDRDIERRSYKITMWVCGGIVLPVQGYIADKVGILNSYWLTIGLLAYVLLYAHVLSKPAKRAE